MVVTIDPEKNAWATKQLEIKDVRSFTSGRVTDARKFIERPTYDRLIRVRGKLQEARHRKKVRIICAICGVPVYLVAKTKRDFYFRHTLEDGKCPAVTRSKLTADEIKAMKYLGARESPAHIGILSRDYPFATRRDPIPSWQKRATSLRAEGDPHKALKKYRAFMDQTEELRALLDEAHSQADAYVEEQIDRAREERALREGR